METGLRRSELATLTTACIDFEGDVPTISILPEHTKNRQGASQPIRRKLAAELHRFVEARGFAPHSRLWPKLTRNTSKMVKRDLMAAREAWLEEAEGAGRADRERSDFLTHVDSSGRFADFHALRHSYISLVTQAGVHPKLAQRLARHSDINLTMSRYSHTLLADEAQALEVLPSFPSAFGVTHDERQTLAATGTDDVIPTKGRAVETVLPTGLPKPTALGCISTHSDAQSQAERSIPFEVCDDSEKSHKRRANPSIGPESESGDAQTEAIWGVRLRVRTDHSGIDLLPAPGR